MELSVKSTLFAFGSIAVILGFVQFGRIAYLCGTVFLLAGLFLASRERQPTIRLRVRDILIALGVLAITSGFVLLGTVGYFSGVAFLAAGIMASRQTAQSANKPIV